MNIKNICMVCSLAVLATFDVRAQNINLSSAPVRKIKNLNYIGASPVHFYYSADKNAICLFNRKDLNTFITFNIAYDDKKESSRPSKVVDGKLYGFSGLTEQKDNKYQNFYTVYLFDPLTGQKIKSVKTGGTAEKNIFFNSDIDTAAKQIRVSIGDSTVALMDYNLEPVDFDKNVKIKRKYDFNLNDMMIDLELLLSSISSKATFTLSGDMPTTTTTWVDSTSVKGYLFSSLRKNDPDVPFFKKSYTKVTFNSRKKDSKRKDLEFELSTDKKIIDMMLREDKSGNLIVVGKYIISTDQMNHFGLFSIKYDQDLQELSPLKYYDLVKNNAGEKTVANKKFLGLFYTRLNKSSHKFELDDDAVLMVYQKSFNNVKDHIYILKVEASGELLVNMIANQVIIDKKLPYRTENFVPVLLGNKLVFMFYENPRNLELSAGEVNVAWCDASDKSSVLVSCTYEIDNDNVRKKKVIAENKDLKTKPHLNDYTLITNNEYGGITCLVPGETDKNVSKVLYRFDLTN